METRRRTIVKAASYRVFGTLVTTLIGWFVTGSIGAGLGIGLADSALKIGVFYAHERLWHRVHWGRLPYDVRADPGSGI